MNVLVVGGAGYIGSHCVRQLVAAGHRPVVLDNLVFGHRTAVAPGIPFYDGNLGDVEQVVPILRQEKIELVMHFAAYCYVGESVTNPLKYYENNLVAPLRLLGAMLSADVKKFVFSSTCATYGIPAKLPMTGCVEPFFSTRISVPLLSFTTAAHGSSAQMAATAAVRSRIRNRRTRVPPIAFESSK